MTLAPPKQRKRGLSQSSSSSASQQQDSKSKRFKGSSRGVDKRANRAVSVSSSASSSSSSSSSDEARARLSLSEGSSDVEDSEDEEVESSEYSDSQDSVKDQFNAMLGRMSPGEKQRYLDEQDDDEDEYDLDGTSSSSSSSSSSSGDQGESTKGRGVARSSSPITSIPRSQKPLIGRSQTKDSSRMLQRLSQFIPAIAEANRAIDMDRAAGKLDRRNMETVTEDEAHIEMNLGMGILEQKVEGGDGTDVIDEDPTKDVLQKLMGQESGDISKPSIKEL